MRILVMAAHLDDEILGVGGTILKHVEQNDEVHICIAAKGYEPQWDGKRLEEEKEQAKKTDDILKVKKRHYLNLPVVKLNTLSTGEINSKVSSFIESINPDIIYTHFENDINEDHKILFRAVMVGTRPIDKRIKLICFETLSSTEWNDKAFVPNYYVNIDKHIDKKIEAFKQYIHEVKKYPHPRSPEGIKILAKKRGMDVSWENAEAFIIVKDYW
jgi:LmbE family N-acetylglucosaminyl deacetylase